LREPTIFYFLPKKKRQALTLHNNTASLSAIIKEAGSSLPVLGYSAPYADANILLTVWGNVIINIM